MAALGGVLTATLFVIVLSGQPVELLTFKVKGIEPAEAALLKLTIIGLVVAVASVTLVMPVPEIEYVVVGLLLVKGRVKEVAPAQMVGIVPKLTVEMADVMLGQLPDEAK